MRSLLPAEKRCTLIEAEQLNAQRTEKGMLHSSLHSDRTRSFYCTEQDSRGEGTAELSDHGRQQLHRQINGGRLRHQDKNCRP